VPLLFIALLQYPQSTLAPKSDFSGALDALFTNIFWWAVAVFVIVEALLLFAIIRFRARPGGPEPKAVHGHTLLEIGWTLAPALILVFIAVPTIQTVFATAGHAPAGALRVEVIGHQWWWEYRYPELGITTANELHVPVEYALHLYERLWTAGERFGIANAGYRAINSLRLEKHYLIWGADITPDYNPYEAGLGFCVALGKGEFMARAALAAIKAKGPRQRLAWFTAPPEIDLFGGTRAAVAGAEARSDQAALGWHAARISLAADVAQSYVGLRSCEAQRAVLEQDAASQAQTASLTREKVRVGFEAPANGALADGAAADASNRATAQRADCEVLLQALVVFTGQPTAALRSRLAERSGTLPQPAAFAVTTLPTQLLAQRPDIAAAERNVVAAAAEVGVAEAARYPRLSFNGSLGIAGLRAGGSSSDGSTWGFGPALTLPLFDAGQRAANRDAAVARYDEARAALDARLRSAVGEVEEALLRLDAATRREADALRAAQGFRDFFAAAESRWRIGAGSLIDREDARRIALNAQSALLTVQRERVAAWVTLYRVLGGGWSATDAAPLNTK